MLAAFYTVFNVLGGLLLPFVRRMVHLLEARFRSAEEDEARPRYLDRNLVTTPELAVHALVRELTRVGRAGAPGRVSVRELVAWLDLLSNERRLLQQLERAARYLAQLDVAAEAAADTAPETVSGPA